MKTKTKLALGTALFASAWMLLIFGTLAISDAPAVAFQHLRTSPETTAEFGAIDHSVLFATTVQASGGRNCTVLNYLVFGEKGWGVTNMHLLRKGVGQPYQVVATGFGLLDWSASDSGC